MTITVSRVLTRRRALRRPRAGNPPAELPDRLPVYPPWHVVMGHTVRRHVKDLAALIATAAFLTAIVAAGFWLLTMQA